MNRFIKCDLLLCNIIFIVAIFSGIEANAQTSSNIGFENGNFLNWQGGTGQCCPITTPLSGIVPGRQVITSGSATDPITGGIVLVSHPESQYSCKLGNETGNSESESLYRTFTIPSDSLALVLRYAVVLQNAQHPTSKQPRFSYEINTTGSVPEGCLKQIIIAGDTTLPFEHYVDLDILNWQTSVINLTGKSGDQLSVRFETGDCEPGGHFGFAYVDLNLVPVQFQLNGCDANGNWMAIAPEGLPGIWESGSTNDTLMFSGSSGTNYIVNSGSTCEFAIPVTPEHLFPDATFTVETLCDLNIALTSGGDSTLFTEWSTGDGTFINGPIVSHQYSAPGQYEISLTVHGSNNCVTSVSQSTIIAPSPEVSFYADTVCANFPLQIYQQSVNCDWLNWYADGTSIGSGTTDHLTFYGAGLHEITLIGGSTQGCSDSLTKSIFFPSEADCFFADPYLFAPNSFTPNGDGINDYYTLINYTVFSVYNRMGQLIYQGSSWDGKYKNKNVQEGVYLVVADTFGATHKNKRIPVSLIR